MLTTSILSLYLGPQHRIGRRIIRMSVIEQATNPLSQFLYALKAYETRRQWPNRLKVFFDFLGLVGNLDEHAKQFTTLCKEGGTDSVQDYIAISPFSPLRPYIRGFYSPRCISASCRNLYLGRPHLSGCHGTERIV